MSNTNTPVATPSQSDEEAAEDYGGKNASDIFDELGNAGSDQPLIEKAFLAGIQHERGKDNWIKLTDWKQLPIDEEVIFWHVEGWIFSEIVDKDTLEVYLKIATHFQIILPPTT